MSKDKRMIYRTIAQTESGLTITAETDHAVTMERAELDVEEHVLPKKLQTELKPYVTLPVATEDSWKHGHVNYCPRCGKHLWDEEGTDSNRYLGDCAECGADLDISITVHPATTYKEEN